MTEEDKLEDKIWDLRQKIAYLQRAIDAAIKELEPLLAEYTGRDGGNAV